ncbi:MAG: GDSL-type esterase/lipase family protein [Oscillochloridaceae bacterium]|nr:GDSL-type esterase/lipase family protein [Chloroflexaceae bacterium]MDW8391385.1 GDSL-type esterase/lipase family protein [Oscillochloridaceae bacterium]
MSDTQPTPVRRVVFFGDSRADWWLPPQAPGFMFINTGVPGAGAGYLARRFTAMVAPLRPAIVVLQLGVNDLAARWPDPATQEAVVEAITAVVAEARALGTEVILTTIFPLARGLWADPATQEAIAAVNERLGALAGAGVRVLDSAAILCGPDGYVLDRYADDELHLSAAGYAALNAALLPLLGGAAVG